MPDLRNGGLLANCGDKLEEAELLDIKIVTEVF